jgi:putative drug exporter of the RND superfamily
MNLLAAAASFGVVVAVFQWGWFGDLLGTGSGGPISASLPVLFFAILFGLSMDYQVFLVSRIHEEWVHTRDNHRAVNVGQVETGGIITAAGLIMIAVFARFMFSEERLLQMIGIGLGGAVFLDAFVVRTMLVPAVMHRLGAANWWYPAWLERITPRVSVEPPDEPPGPDRTAKAPRAQKA